MAKINLLPWRAERRERRKREFFTHLGIGAVAAIVLVLLWGFWMSLRINNQNDRNEYLQGQITQLDSKITEIKSLQKVKKHLLDRKRIVEKLQSSRSQMVHLFDQIVETIPAGARLTGLKEVENGDTETLTLDGVAQSNATVAEYMRNIEASPWMGPATLVKTENVHSDSNTPYEFELVVKLGTPKSDDDGSGAAPSSSAASVAATALSTAPVAAVASTAVKPASTVAAPVAAPGASMQAAP
ncbi:MAG TPA: PilN domain-containing protein, partial [Rhodanobacteraceae bacterium]|nr:PilN domain-containing protein [Rhodanobacteraceae bacterium]